MLKIGVIGAGHHSCTFHLPALAHYRTLHPGTIELVVICDRDLTRAKAAAAKFGFQLTGTDHREIARLPSLDGCLILTPPAATLEATGYLLRNAAMPMLMEKPLGENLAEARAFLALQSASHARTMVSMNRRYDPGLRSAIDWIGKRAVEYLHVTMARVGRVEPEFMWRTGLHVVDAVVAFLGNPSTWSIDRRSVVGASWNFIRLRCGETLVQIDVLPTAGAEIELFEFHGADFSVAVRTGQVPQNCSVRAWQDGKLAHDTSPADGTPSFIVDGTYAETEAFLAAIRGEQAFSPTPSDVQAASEICADFEPIVPAAG